VSNNSAKSSMSSVLIPSKGSDEDSLISGSAIGSGVGSGVGSGSATGSGVGSGLPKTLSRNCKYRKTICYGLRCIV